MFSKIKEIYDEVERQADPVIKKWFLMNSIWFPIVITLAYLYIILSLGPKLMKNREAFNINKIILIYNIVQVIFNAYLFKETIVAVLYDINSFRCLKVFPAGTEKGDHHREIIWLYILNKLMDFLDTIFFVMKKKQSHVSFLHVYHHVFMFVGSWGVCKYRPDGEIIIVGLLNTVVHCVMYSYYLLSLMHQFNGITNFIKKRITQMQIAQFVLAGIHAVYGITDPTCNHSKGLVYFGLCQGVLLIVLFVNFYRKAYQTHHQLQNQSPKKGLTKKTH